MGLSIQPIKEETIDTKQRVKKRDSNSLITVTSRYMKKKYTSSQKEITIGSVSDSQREQNKN